MDVKKIICIMDIGMVPMVLSEEEVEFMLDISMSKTGR